MIAKLFQRKYVNILLDGVVNDDISEFTVTHAATVNLSRQPSFKQAMNLLLDNNIDLTVGAICRIYNNSNKLILSADVWQRDNGYDISWHNYFTGDTQVYRIDLVDYLRKQILKTREKNYETNNIM